MRSGSEAAFVRDRQSAWVGSDAIPAVAGFARLRLDGLPRDETDTGLLAARPSRSR